MGNLTQTSSWLSLAVHYFSRLLFEYADNNPKSFHTTIDYKKTLIVKFNRYYQFKTGQGKTWITVYTWSQGDGAKLTSVWINMDTDQENISHKIDTVD